MSGKRIIAFLVWMALGFGLLHLLPDGFREKVVMLVTWFWAASYVGFFLSIGMLILGVWGREDR